MVISGGIQYIHMCTVWYGYTVWVYSDNNASKSTTYAIMHALTYSTMDGGLIQLVSSS